MPASDPSAQGARASSEPAETPEDLPKGSRSPIDAAHDWFTDQVPWLTSSVVNAIVLLTMALMPLVTLKSSELLTATADLTENDDIIDQLPVCPLPQLDIPAPVDPLDVVLATANSADVEQEINHIVVGPIAPAPPLPPNPLPGGVLPPIPPGGAQGADDDGSWKLWGNRTGRRRHLVGGPDGPTEESEAAVEAALAWLAAHQLRDGSWSFDHRGGPCQGRCKDHGQFAAAKNAATALAILTYLGAGETHCEGRYQNIVAAGVRYLMANQKMNGDSGSWHEAVGNSGNYCHALATLAICEAYGMAQMKPQRPPRKSLSEMTEEERKRFREEQEALKRRDAVIPLAKLGASAAAGINYIHESQHADGGWRYNPGQPGDTSIVGWMLMAMKSGYMAKLRVNKNNVIGASKFLDSVQDGEYGSIYHYMPDKTRPPEAIRATTAIGLLCRMYLGWDRNHPAIADGVGNLSKWAPSIGRDTNMYYNYYATQVVYHYGGEPWKKWNAVIRKHLVDSQAKAGHEKGSWHFTGDHGSASGGRLYATALAAMTLEVYYRYMPIYRRRSVEDDLQKEKSDELRFRLVRSD